MNKTERNKARSEAALAMTAWMQQQIVPSVSPGPASSLRKGQTDRETDREAGAERDC